MGLSETRKILSNLLAVLLACCLCVLLCALGINATVTRQRYLEKHFITEELVQECTEQLDAKYAVLESETGIPQRVFAAVKDDYKVEESLKTALQNAFGAEDTALYNSNMVNYFNNLCTEYLDDSGVIYDADAVAAAANEAALIFSDTVGMHNIDSLSVNIFLLQRTLTTTIAASAFGTVLCIILIFVMYTNRKKAAVYALAGVCGGALGAGLGSIGCLVLNAASALGLSPAVYQAAAEALANHSLAVFAACAFGLFAVSYAALIYFQKTADRKSKRQKIF